MPYIAGTYNFAGVDMLDFTVQGQTGPAVFTSFGSSCLAATS